jgi:hypothetical protein
MEVQSKWDGDSGTIPVVALSFVGLALPALLYYGVQQRKSRLGQKSFEVVAKGIAEPEKVRGGSERPDSDFKVGGVNSARRRASGRKWAATGSTTTADTPADGLCG